MTRQVETREIDMELAEIPGTSLKVSRVAIGTWAKRWSMASISSIRRRCTDLAGPRRSSAKRSPI